MQELSRIIEQLQFAQHGAAWHGPNLMKILEGVSAQQAAAHPIPNAHSIWEIMEHMMAWRLYTMKKLEGNAEYDPDKDMALNFPAVNDFSEAAWEDCKRRLEQTCGDLVTALQREDDSLLERTVPGRTFSFYKLLHGIVQHDLYHGGQLILLKKFPA